MSTQRHGPSDIAARTDETAVGTACSTAVPVRTTWHGPSARRWPMSTRRYGPSDIAARTHKTAVGTARSAVVPVHALRLGHWHDSTNHDEYMTVLAVGHRRLHAQDGGWHGPLCSGARSSNTACAVGTTVPMSTRRHGPSVIAAHTHETAAGRARSAAVLMHRIRHGPSARRYL